MAYNANGQMVSQSWISPPSLGPSGGLTYTYPGAGQNNGQITQISDTLSGETIAYSYDALKRLTSASSTPQTGSPASPWTQSFQFDGFGNLTAKVLNGTPTAIPVNAATNQLTAASYDLNGNMLTGQAPGSGLGVTYTYDAANRITSAALTSGGAEYYGYSPVDNRRVYRMTASGTEQWTVYGAYGEKLGVFQYNSSGELYPVSSNVSFAGRTIQDGNFPVFQDRLGTNRASGARFYPYGDEISSTSNDREKFATYTRDSYTGLDYADQRFYASTYGNFTTPDPSMKNVDYSNPMTWNAYNYANGDPINGNDPTGLDVDIPITGGGSATSCLNSVFTPWLNANTNISLGSNFGNFANTDLGALALTSFFEEEAAISSLYSNIDQVMLNRYWLDQSNPALAKQLGIPSGSFASVVEASSNVWSNGDLKAGFTDQIISIMNGSGKASGCTQFMSSLNVANGAVGQLNNPGSTVAGSTLQGSGWYWFYTGSGNDPVDHTYWNTNINQWNGTNWYFEQLIGPKPPAPRPRRPPPPRNPRRPGPLDDGADL